MSRRFVARSPTLLAEWLARPLGALDIVAVLIDGIYFDERCVLIALRCRIRGERDSAAVAGAGELKVVLSGC